MASTKEYADYILEQLSGLDGISSRKMMGEYILYCDGKVIGGIYDNRFLVKPVSTATALMPSAPRELPYEGAKEMLLVENTDDREFLEKLVISIAEELPKPLPRRGKAPLIKVISDNSMMCRSEEDLWQNIVKAPQEY